MNRQRYTASASIIALISAMTLHGCTDDFGIRDIDLPGEYVRFTATQGYGGVAATTRSTADHLVMEEELWPVDGAEASATRGKLTSNMEGSVGVSGVAVSGSFANDEYKFDGDELKTSGTTEARRWSTVNSNGQITFFAYAPFLTGEELAAAPFSGYNATTMTVNYTVPTDIGDQKDLIADTTVVKKDKFGNTVKFAFEHLLTGIRFKAGFDCTVNRIEVSGVYNRGTFSFLANKIAQTGTTTGSYTINFTDGKAVKAGDFITLNDTILMMIPQELPAGATVKFYYDGLATPITAGIGSKVWAEGKLITYTIYKEKPNYVYFDLAAGNVTINNSTYTGYRFKKTADNTYEPEMITAAHDNDNIYYVYQTTAAFSDDEYDIPDNRGTHGYINGTFKRPEYDGVEGPNGGSWADYITNNKCVEDVIEAWDDGVYVKGSAAACEKMIGKAVVRDAGRTHTEHYIDITRTSPGFICNLTIDNLYSTYQQKAVGRTTAGIAFKPSATTKSGDHDSKLYINIVGDNRLGAVHYSNISNNGNEIIFSGSGTLTVADTDFDTEFHNSDSYYGLENNAPGYVSNHWCAAIGNNDSQDKCYGIVINSGIIFAGTTKAENCSAIGGGGNGYGEVTINGGTVTAVAATTGTAIGGGIGYNSKGGVGHVTIKNGNVYAYNFANRWKVPSSAIGGAGSYKSEGSLGTINISGGNIYAESDLGTAIGGGSSYSTQGGDATITITGGKIVAKSNTESAGIGGGCSLTEGFAGPKNSKLNGGNATIKISGNPIIRTGSIGGGTTGADKGKIGSANITVEGGDIQAQFVMTETDAANPPAFTMSGGTIRNSNTTDGEYTHVQPYGGAVYMANGTFTMSGGTIKNCSAEQGGAVYITDPDMTDDNIPTFIMTGGTIEYCTSQTDGGALYLAGGEATINDSNAPTAITHNMVKGGNGGGICIKQGNFHLTGTEPRITNNTALSSGGEGGNGGGVYVSSDKEGVVVELLAGYIANNTTDRNGGGIHVDMPSGSVTITVGAKVDDNTSGPSITGNHSILEGGGLYANGAGANIIINGGSITGNTVSGYVDNPNVANNRGMVTLNDPDVTTSIVVTYDGNKGFTKEGEQPAMTQNIVTNTNSMLVIPEFARAGWILIGWNDRADGLGEWYWRTDNKDNINNKPLYRSTDLTLYAQWELQ